MPRCDRAWVKIISNLIHTVSASMGFVLAARVRWNELAVNNCGVMRFFGLDGDNL